MIRRATLALLALPLASCQHVTQRNGDETISATSVFTNINVASDCLQMDGDGNILSQTHHTLTTSGDTATLHEAGSIFGSALAAVLAKGATGGLAARGDGRMGAVPSPSGSPAVTGCSGEQTVSTRPQPAPAPVPPPPYKPAAFEPGWHQGVNPAGERTRRYLRAADPAGGAVEYATPGGRLYRVSAGAWLAWAEGGA
jgi:hypothetical protein